MVAAETLGWLTETQMIEVDRVMIEDLRIELVQMMENAGRNLARLAIDRFDPDSVVVFCGSGGNGGGGMVAARHLANAGVGVTVVVTRRPEELAGVPGHQIDILDRMGVPVVDAPSGPYDLTVDALIGYSLRGAPVGRTAELIDAINTRDRPALALDTPSGLDVTDGTSPGVAVGATATMTLCLPKAGLRDSSLVGELYLADISVPPAVTAELGPSAPDFGASSILRIA